MGPSQLLCSLLLTVVHGVPVQVQMMGSNGPITMPLDLGSTSANAGKSAVKQGGGSSAGTGNVADLMTNDINMPFAQSGNMMIAMPDFMNVATAQTGNTPQGPATMGIIYDASSTSGTSNNGILVDQQYAQMANLAVSNKGDNFANGGGAMFNLMPMTHVGDSVFNNHNQGMNGLVSSQGTSNNNFATWNIPNVNFGSSGGIINSKVLSGNGVVGNTNSENFNSGIGGGVTFLGHSGMQNNQAKSSATDNKATQQMTTSLMPLGLTANNGAGFVGQEFVMMSVPMDLTTNSNFMSTQGTFGTDMGSSFVPMNMKQTVAESPKPKPETSSQTTNLNSIMGLSHMAEQQANAATKSMMVPFDGVPTKSGNTFMVPFNIDMTNVNLGSNGIPLNSGNTVMVPLNEGMTNKNTGSNGSPFNSVNAVMVPFNGGMTGVNTGVNEVPFKSGNTMMVPMNIDLSNFNIGINGVSSTAGNNMITFDMTNFNTVPNSKQAKPNSAIKNQMMNMMKGSTSVSTNTIPTMMAPVLDTLMMKNGFDMATNKQAGSTNVNMATMNGAPHGPDCNQGGVQSNHVTNMQQMSNTANTGQAAKMKY